MATHSPCSDLSNSRNDVNLYHEQSRILEPVEIAPFSNTNWELDFLHDLEPDPVLQYINQMLLEENMEGEPGMFHDPVALKTTEKSFYDVLGKDFFSSSPHESVMCNEQNTGQSSSHSRELSSASSFVCSMSADPQWSFDPKHYESSLGRENLSHYSPLSSVPVCLPTQSNSFCTYNDGGTNTQIDAFAKPTMIPNILSDSESILLFKQGMEEGSKFLPSGSQLIADSAKYTFPDKTGILTSELVVNVENVERAEFRTGSRGRKHRHTDDNELYYPRSSKQYATALSVQEDELTEMFDRVLLNHVPPEDLTFDNIRPTLSTHENWLLNGGRSRARKTGIDCETPDLSALLMSCAQSIAANDMKTANEQLKLIKKCASPIGDPDQRLAILFADALEARLAGTGPERYKALSSKRISAAEELKAYRVYHTTPFKAISVLFGNQMILERASKANTLHIIDFGISYGFQWPSLIQHLSRRPGGPPKLRITGIETPLPGFRPAEGVEETGRRLARYCNRFKVPFEYSAIATWNWESIRVEELKVTRGEVLVVYCQYRFKSLLDETIDEKSPKDAVLNLIRNLNPDIFLNDHVNGSHGSTFFPTRFREAFSHFSALFDAIDNNLPRDDEQRLKFEPNFFGAQIMNLVACEGRDRIERPETYKQWQIRNIRAGFKLLPLNKDLMKELRSRVKKNYHKDFVFDEDGSWMLQGWKGRIITASSCWIPA